MLLSTTRSPFVNATSIQDEDHDSAITPHIPDVDADEIGPLEDVIPTAPHADIRDDKILRERHESAFSEDQMPHFDRSDTGGCERGVVMRAENQRVVQDEAADTGQQEAHDESRRHAAVRDESRHLQR